MTKHLLTLLTIGILLSACAPQPAATEPSTEVQIAAMVESTEDSASPTPKPTSIPAPPTPDIETAHVDETPGTMPIPDEGITVRKVLSTGGGRVRLVADPLDGSLYILEPNVNIYRVNLSAERPTIATKYTALTIGVLTEAYGLTIGPDGTMYVLGNQNDGIRTQAIVRKGVLDADGKRIWSTLMTTEPYALSNTFFDHRMNGMAVSPDGQSLFIASGSRTDHGEVETNTGAFPYLREEPITSSIFRVPTDAQDLVLPNDEFGLQPYLYADGFRNAYDMAFAANGELFAIDNGPDADYMDELNWIQEGHHYGFPWQFGNQPNPQQFADYDPLTDPLITAGNATYHNDPDFPIPGSSIFTNPVVNLGPDAAWYRDSKGIYQNAAKIGDGLFSFTPHRSPLGLVFDTENSITGQYQGYAFVLGFGAYLGEFEDRGHDLLALKLIPDVQYYSMSTTQIVSGFANPIDAVLLNGKLYVLDFSGEGNLWEVTFSE